jgi:hypothetical protein
MLEANVKDADKVEKNKKKVTWGTVLTNKYAVCALLCIYNGTYNIIYYESFIETYFIDLGDEGYAGISLLV